MEPLVMNPGAQQAFFDTDALYALYAGGVGAGKTHVGLARGLKYAFQPKPPGMLWGPRGLICSATYRALTDGVIPKFREMIHGRGIADWGRDFKKSEMSLQLSNNGIINFRSLDNPDWQRGPEYTWFFIDEGRNATKSAWDVLVGRLRQPGYKVGGWVASTTNGFDWMWDVFSPDSPTRNPNSVMFTANTNENRAHLPEHYIEALDAAYVGRWHEQEVEGKFMALVSGAVFPLWDPDVSVGTYDYDPALSLHSFWDFGIGDPGCCIFAQLAWLPFIPATVDEPDEEGTAHFLLPTLKIIDYIFEKDWSTREWAEAWHAKLEERFDGRIPDSSWGDPAGNQRNPVTKTSTIADLNRHGVPIGGAPKRQLDWSVRTLSNMMEAGRVVVDAEHALQVSRAIQTHRWKVDGNGQRVGRDPVHDWTSHHIAALRYGANALLLGGPRQDAPIPNHRYLPTQMGYILKQLDERDEDEEFWLGPQPTFKLRFVPTITPRGEVDGD